MQFVTSELRAKARGRRGDLRRGVTETLGR